ncbi:MAG: hypothetical protein IKZ09_05520 [Clostridia bacterium]|nr:hypothetical protein [Clostridia bacterium]
MNKLDAISRRSKGMRTLVRLIKTAITGCGACLLIASSTQLQFGGVTYALDNDILSGPNAVPAQIPAEISVVPDNGIPLDEAYVLQMFPPEQPAEAVEPIVYERPYLAAPEGWVGNAVTFDGNGSPLLYGNALVSMTAKTSGGTPEKSARADDTYFSEDTLFVGNSLVVGLQKVGVIDTTYYANIGMSVKQFFEKPMFLDPNGSGKTVTTAEAVVREGDYRRVYLMFGVNELGWPGSSAFIDYYERLIDLILNVRPDAVIYVQGLLPMNEAIYQATADLPSDLFTNERIALYNEKLKALAARKQVVYLNPGEVIADENGILPADATTDGIHLNGTYIRRWAEYLYTHTVDDVDPALFYQAEAITE